MNSAVFITEYRTLASGITALDCMCKNTQVTLLHGAPICIGKYLICVGGDVSDVREAKELAMHEANDGCLSSYLLSSAHPAVLAYFRKQKIQPDAIYDCVGIFETKGAAAGFQSLDAALKSANVSVLRIWLGQLLGGKYCFVVAGGTSDVKNALTAAAAAIDSHECVDSKIISRPSEDILQLLIGGGGR